MDPHQASADHVRLFADGLEDDHSGEIKPLLWESRAATSAAVGKCSCGLLLKARHAERPPYSTAVYRDVYCAAGHEASIVGTYKGKTIGTPPGVIDTTTARHQREEPTT